MGCRSHPGAASRYLLRADSNLFLDKLECYEMIKTAHPLPSYPSCVLSGPLHHVMASRYKSLSSWWDSPHSWTSMTLIKGRFCGIKCKTAAHRSACFISLCPPYLLGFAFELFACRMMTELNVSSVSQLRTVSASLLQWPHEDALGLEFPGYWVIHKHSCCR